MWAQQAPPPPPALPHDSACNGYTLHHHTGAYPLGASFPSPVVYNVDWPGEACSACTLLGDQCGGFTVDLQAKQSYLKERSHNEHLTLISVGGYWGVDL